MRKVLIADPNPSFAAMIQQVLEETRLFQVTVASSGAEAIGVASREPFDIVILESSLEDFSLRDAVTVLRRTQPYLPIMVILPFGEQALPDAAKFFDVQGILSKPLYIPDLQNQIEEALTKPVNGVAPTARPIQPASANHPTTQLHRPTPPPAPAWLDDVSRAAQYLTTLTLGSSAEAALLMRGHQLLAFAGQCTQEDANELAQAVAAHWASSGGGGQGAQVRFIRLASDADYLVYSTLAAQDVVLSMAFQAETPLGQIRKQAKRAADVLLQTSAAQTQTPTQTDSPSPAPSDDAPRESDRAATIVAPPREESVERIDWDSSAIAPPAEALPDWVPTPPQPDVEPIPDEASLNELSNAVLQLSRQSLAEPPAAFNFQPAELQTSNVRRTPHALYDLSYTFLFIPRLPHITLIGDLKTRLEQWLALLADAHEWQTQFLCVEPTHIEISLACPPTDSPERIIKAILLETSARVLEDFPRYAAAHSKRPGAFWSPGYYVVAPGRRLSPQEVSAFIEYQRREQNP